MDPGADLLDLPEAGARAIRGSGLRAVGYLAGLALSVGSAALLLRYLGVRDAGTYVTVLSLVTIAGGLTDAGLTTIGMRELSVRPREEARELLRNLLGLRIVLSLVAVAGATAFAAVAGYGARIVAGTVLAGGGLVLQYLSATLAVGLMTRLRLGWVTAIELLRQALTAVLTVALVVAGADLVALLAVPAPVGVIVVGLTAVLVRGDVPLRPALDAVAWRSIMREILPVAVGVAVAIVYLRVSVIVMSLVASDEEVGYFGASFRIVEVLGTLPSMMISALFPILARAARDDHARLQYALQRTLEGCAILGGGVAIALSVGASVAIDVVAGEDFAPSVAVLRIQAFALGALFLTAVFTYALLSVHRYRAMLVAGLIGLIASGGGSLVLGATSGAQGAAVATVVAEVVLAVVSAGLLLRGHRHLMPSLGFGVKVLGAMAVAGGVALIPGLPALPATALALAAYATVLFALRAVPAELVDAVASRVRS